MQWEISHLQEGSHQNLLAPKSVLQLPELEKYISMVDKLSVYGILLQQPEVTKTSFLYSPQTYHNTFHVIDIPLILC